MNPVTQKRYKKRRQNKTKAEYHQSLKNEHFSPVYFHGAAVIDVDEALQLKQKEYSSHSFNIEHKVFFLEQHDTSSKVVFPFHGVGLSHFNKNEQIKESVIQETEGYKELNSNLKKIWSFDKLEKNWDGYGAMPFSKELIFRVQAFLKKLPVQPEVFPTGRESIQLEYGHENGGYLEFEIYLDRIDMYQDLRGEELEDENISEDRMLELIEKFHA